MSLTTVDGSLISSGAITLTTQVTGTLPEANGGTGTTVGYCGSKNRLINGGMVIDQRNAGASVTPANGAYTLDRYVVGAQQASKFSVQQNAGAVTLPVGFSKYLGVTSLSSYSVLAADFFEVGQIIEGQNIYDLAWGTANAKTVTLSFQVYSSLTGSFGGNILNSGETRCYPFIYSIPVANTWTSISITIAGDTSGTWLTTNGVGIRVDFSLGMGTTYSGTAGAWAAANYASATGATSVVSTNGATWYVTGVQLEQNTVATPFERRLYNTELANCQRYYFVAASGNSVAYATGSYQTTTYVEAMVNFPVQMRTTATSEVVTGTNYYGIYRINTSDFFNSLLQEYSSIFGSTVYNNSEASGTAGNAGWMFTNNASAKIAFSAEL